MYRELGVFSDEIGDEQLHEIREALNLELVLGRQDFIEKIELVLQRKLVPGKPGRPRTVEELAGTYYVY